MENKIIYVGEYSHEQKSFNITTLEEAIRMNWDMARKGIFNGYVPICYGYSFQDVSNQMDELSLIIRRMENEITKSI